MPGLRVDRIGPGATIQDRGRWGFREVGVSVGGAFDRGSHDLANALLGNEPGAAGLELSLFGGEFVAEVSLAIALAGAPMAARIGGRDLAVPGSATLRPGDRLVIGGCRSGARTYLAVLGGWRTPLILGSRSSEARIEAGAVLPAEPGEAPSRRPAVLREIHDSGPIRVVDGPDLGADARLLERGEFAASNQSDRMGLRLEGPPVAFEGPADRASAPVAPGTVQVAGLRLLVLGVAGGDDGRLSPCRPGHLRRPRPPRPGPTGRRDPIPPGRGRQSPGHRSRRPNRPVPMAGLDPDPLRRSAGFGVGRGGLEDSGLGTRDSGLGTRDSVWDAGASSGSLSPLRGEGWGEGSGPVWRLESKARSDLAR